MTRVALAAYLSHWRRQPLQLVTLILGLALATALWSAVQAINDQARASYAKAAQQLGFSQMSHLTSATGTIPLQSYVTLRRNGWLVSPVLEGRTRLDGHTVTLMGVDFLTYPLRPEPLPGQPAITSAQALMEPGILLAHPEMLDKGAQVVEGLQVIRSGQVPFGFVMTDIGLAEQLLDRQGQITRLLVLPDQPMGLSPLGELVPHLTLNVPRGSSDIARLTDSFHLNLTAFGLLSFAVGLFIVHGTVGLAFEQRRGKFRSLRALGAPLRVLGQAMLIELMLFAIGAGALGLVLGYLVAAALLPDVTATLRGLYGAPVSDGLSLSPLWIASGLGMAVTGALLAGSQTLWQLKRLPILAAPGVQNWNQATERKLRIQAIAGGAAFIAGMLSTLFLSGLLAGFALLAGVMLGAALVLPPVLGWLLNRASGRANAVIPQWFWADLRVHLPGLSLALMALLLALATNIGVGTMVSSFRLTFEGWLDQRLASELYVTTRDDGQGEQVRTWLLDRSDAVLPIRYVESRVNDQPTWIYGIKDHPTYREHWPLIDALPRVWDDLASGQSVLINEQLARRSDLWSGDHVQLVPGWTLRIAGVYSDYGNPTGQAIVSMVALLAHFDNVPNRRFGIRIDPARASALAKDLGSAFDLPDTAIVDQASLKARSLKVFEKTFVVTRALNVLTLGVAGFAILTSLLTLWTMRLPQLAPVWALGMTRAQLARLELLRSVTLAALTAVLALPLGLVLAWVLLAVINVEAFGWRLPMHLFPLDWLRLWVLAVLAGGVAAALPARRLHSTPPSDLLKVFSNER